MKLILDFTSDWTEFLRKRLNSAGYNTASLADDRIPLVYFNAVRRRVPNNQRVIERSRELNCPAQHEKGLAKLEEAVRRGDDLKPWLSRRLKSVAYNDPLLNDWGIYHLHLGTQLESDGFIKRTGDVLFALITSDRFYEIQIYPHEQWSNQEVVKIIHTNWPSVIAPRQVKGICGLSHVPTNQDIGDLREANVNTSIQLNDGTVYMALGGGYAADGRAADVVMKRNCWNQRLRAFENTIRKSAAKIEADLREQGFTDAECEFHLVIDGTGAYGLAAQNRLKVWLSKESNLLPL